MAGWFLTREATKFDRLQLGAPLHRGLASGARSCSPDRADYQA